ncbi:hypothetical protein ACFX2G_042343 [Malus domestica]
MSNPQLADFSSSNPRRPRICSESYIHSWENPFPVPQPGQESVMVEKTTNFKDTDVITKLVVWAHLPRVPVQYKKKNIIKDITQPIGRVIRVDERVLIVNHEVDYPILISYKKIFEDEPPVYPEDVVVDDDVKASLQKNVMLYFPNATIVDEDYNEVEEFGQRVEDMGLDEDGWTTVVPRWKKKMDKRKMGDNSRDDRSYREVVASPKPKWVAKAHIVQDWRKAGKSKEKH